MEQLSLFDDAKKEPTAKSYSHILTVSENRKGILDVDTVKGCTFGMRAYPQGGCYGECYARKIAVRFNLDFGTAVSRKLLDREHMATIVKLMNDYKVTWYRIGTSGDPCHDWANTLVVCRALRHTGKIPVIVTKHWATLSDNQIIELRGLRAVVNTSTSGMDTDAEIKHRIAEFERLCNLGVKSILRVVTCDYGTSDWAKACREKQDYLLSVGPVIDNPFRVGKSNEHVLNGDILVTKKEGCIGGKFVSLHSPSAYLGICDSCPDQCGVDCSAMQNQNTSAQLWIGV